MKNTKYICYSKIEPPSISQKQTLVRMKEDIPSKLLVSFTKPAENTLQEKVQAQFTSMIDIDTADTLRQVLSEYYQ